MIVYCKINFKTTDDFVTKTQWGAILDFCRSWTEQIESESDQSWYCNLPKHFSAIEFGEELNSCLKSHGLTGVWGGGTSKLLAKLMADRQPNKVLLPEDTQKFLADLPVNMLPLTEASLLNKLGIHTFGELADISLKTLALQFGNKAQDLLKLAQGEDIQPFRPEKQIRIVWQKNFLTDPGIATSVARPQLDLFLGQGLGEVEDQLQLARLKITQIELSWWVMGKYFNVVKRFRAGVYRKETLMRCLAGALPQGPVESLKIRGISFIPRLPKQLDIFDENPTNQKIHQLKSCLGDALINLKLTRREKILVLWEQNHL